MTGRRLILAPGGPNETILEGSQAGYAEGVLWLYLEGLTLPEAFGLLSDPARTRAITFEFGEDSVTYAGFTALTGLLAGDGLVRASLERGGNADV